MFHLRCELVRCNRTELGFDTPRIGSGVIEGKEGCRIEREECDALDLIVIDLLWSEHDEEN
jgi:hypothetical protein